LVLTLSFLSLNFMPFESNNNIIKYNSINEKIGHFLFFDKDLSFNQSKSCASCHNPDLIFTDGYNKSLGIYADELTRNTPSLINVSERHYLNLANPNITQLEHQMNGPLFNTSPKEMGVKGHENTILKRLNEKAIYKNLLQGTSKLKINDIKNYIGTYLRTLNTHNSKFDDYQCNINDNALSKIEKQGMELFFSKKMGCGNCHNGINLDTPLSGEIFANTGLYNINKSYPQSDLGVQKITRLAKDNGKFRIPSLKNIALTAPYYHDGSAMTLTQVIDIYAAGGRNIIDGEFIGNGQLHPNKDKRLNSFQLDKAERKALLSFLFALTDTSYLSNPLFLDPFDKNKNN